MERDVQRAILLKAIMELLNKTDHVAQSKFGNGTSGVDKNRFVRFNATRDILAMGVEDYAASIGEYFKDHPGSIPSDPLWKEIIAFAVADKDPGSALGALPPSLANLELWGQVKDRSSTLKEIGGCWYIFRLSTKRHEVEREVTVSLLNIRPAEFYEGRPGNWIEFVLFLHPPGDEDREYRVEGICYQYNLDLHLVGILDRRGSALPTAMSLRYNPSGRATYHRERTTGLIFVTNSDSEQVSAPVSASFVPGSDKWIGDAYTAGRGELLKRLGSHAQADIDDILSREHYKQLLARSADVLVFETR